MISIRPYLVTGKHTPFMMFLMIQWYDFEDIVHGAVVLLLYIEKCYLVIQSTLIEINKIEKMRETPVSIM